MNTRIINVDFKKDKDNRTVLDHSSNLENINKYILPIIERNEGWGTKDITRISFTENPKLYQNDIDASTWDNVHILLLNNEPVGLLEFSKMKVPEVLSSLSNADIVDIRQKTGINFSHEDVNLALIFLRSKPIYSSIGIVLKSEFQSKKTGYVNILYDVIGDGISFGWTSNPIIARLKRKLFKHSLFFPLFDEILNTYEEKAICLLLWAELKTKNTRDVKGLLFGAMYSKYFVEDRGDEYLMIANEMGKIGKLTLQDKRRIEYVLGKKSCAGAIFSWN